MATPIRVLHVDDDPSFTELVVTFLEREDEGIEVTSATSGDEGLSILADRQIDCVVSDYDMSGKSGIEFLEAVRADDPELPFILYTGKGSETVASRAIAAGVTDYLQKGIGSEQYELLANRITNAVGQRRSEQRAAELERIRRVITNIDKALARASTRDEIEDRICRIISDADPYLFAWFGTADPETDTITSRTSAGVEEDYLETIELTTSDQPAGRGPTGAAFRTGEMEVVQNIADDETYAPWRADALERGYESSAAIPLVQGDTLYGVLNVYADRCDAFDAEERDLLEEIADDAAFALNRIESRGRLEAYGRLVDNLPVGVYRATSGPDGEVIDVNPALVDMMGADSPDQLEGSPVRSAYRNPVERRSFSEQLEETGLVEGTELRLETIDGEELWVSVTAIQTEEHGEVYFDGIIQDVTEQKELMRELDRTRAIIEDILALTKSGSVVADRERVDLSSVVARSWASVGTDEATFIGEFERTILADESRLRQVFENLFRNAIEHRDGPITVTGGDLERGFYVEDDGPGIPDGDRLEVFEAGTSTSDTGTGFGLNIVKQIVDAHGWEISLTESADGGARFEITGVEAVAD